MKNGPFYFLGLSLLLPQVAFAGALYGTVRIGPSPAGASRCPSRARASAVRPNRPRKW